MPVRDPAKKAIAQARRLFIKICRTCGARNSPKAEKCRKCHSYNLRWKHREIMGKK
ncbi:MAG: 50S ribosomal protein L40e [Candidatus Bathyarchaeia archaeon]